MPQQQLHPPPCCTASTLFRKIQPVLITFRHAQLPKPLQVICLHDACQQVGEKKERPKDSMKLPADDKGNQRQIEDKLLNNALLPQPLRRAPMPARLGNRGTTALASTKRGRSNSEATPKFIASANVLNRRCHRKRGRGRRSTQEQQRSNAKMRPKGKNILGLGKRE